jgi:hypothetical protein
MFLQNIENKETEKIFVRKFLQPKGLDAKFLHRKDLREKSMLASPAAVALVLQVQTGLWLHKRLTLSRPNSLFYPLTTIH